MMPLSLATVGEPNTIKKIGGSPEVKKHLENLGFVVGGGVTVISTLAGNVIVNVKEDRVAISEELGRKSMVRPFARSTKEGNPMKTLRAVPVGGSAKVVKLHGEGAVKRRIMDMGITKGVAVQVRKVAPLGDPIEVTVRGYELSIRKADADMIQVE